MSSQFSDVFVSYRRKDVEFTKEVVSALQEAGKQVWIDWEDIPPGSVGFADDIKRGLEGADAFICILSPDYLESTYCVDLELGYALQLKKRIVPIVLHKFDDYEIPEGIGAINWVYFTPHAGHENTFDESMPKVLQALDQDLEHSRAHKRFLIRALEWDGHNRKDSYLLVGEEIVAAESWISKASDKTPNPTELHADYITASRAQATKRQRQITAGVAVALVISLALGAVAFWQMLDARYQREQAEIARVQAERNEQVSRSTSLSLGAQEVNNFNQIDALTLALNAVDVQLVEPPAISERTLAGIAYQPGPTAMLNDHRARVRSLAYSHDGTLLVSGAEDRTLIVWDTETNEALQTLSGHRREVSGVAFNSDGTRIVSGGRDEAVIVWDVATGEALQTIEAAGRVLSVAYAPDDSGIVYTTEDGIITLLDAESGDIVTEFAGVTDAVFAAAFMPDGAQLVTGDRGGMVRVWDVETGEAVMSINGHTDTVLDVTVSDDGAWIGSASADRTAIVWDGATGDRIATLLAHTNGVRSIAFSPDGRSVLTGSDDQTAILWSAFNWQPQYVFNAHRGFVRDTVFHPNGLQFASGDTEGQIILWDIQPGNVVSLFADHSATVNAVAFSPDGLEVASASDDTTVVLHDIQNPENTFTFDEHAARVNAVTFSPDGKTVFSASEDLAVLGWSPDDGEVLVSYNQHNVPVFGVAVMPDKATAISVGGIVLSGGELHRWDVETGEQIVAVADGVPPLYSVDVNMDGSRIATGTLDGNIIIWDGETLEQLQLIEAHDGQVNQVLFDEDGTLYSVSNDGIARHWDITDAATVLGEYGEHAGGVRGIARLDDGDDTLIVTASEDDTLQISRVSDGRVIRTYGGHVGDVRALALSADGLMASGGVDGTVILWLYQPLPDVVTWANGERMVQAVDCAGEVSGLVYSLLCEDS